MNNGFDDNNTTETSATDNTSMIQRIAALEQEISEIRDELAHQRTINNKLMEALKQQQTQQATNDDKDFIYNALLTIYEVATRTSTDGYAVRRLHDALRKRV